MGLLRAVPPATAVAISGIPAMRMSCQRGSGGARGGGWEVRGCGSSLCRVTEVAGQRAMSCLV
ncbi:hypothetical protein BE15_16060 [Sorangium cellulosum]|uniref:Uncharacterized protein n=1 Tax=Sorangium cellulosum TaxID=56 RepID=A0A150QQX0_SORCE|nr:hypothetical protein BE15_16060 [Sorangium cellulosum]